MEETGYCVNCACLIATAGGEVIRESADRALIILNGRAHSLTFGQQAEVAREQASRVNHGYTDETAQTATEEPKVVSFEELVEGEGEENV